MFKILLVIIIGLLVAVALVPNEPHTPQTVRRVQSDAVICNEERSIDIRLACDALDQVTQ